MHKLARSRAVIRAGHRQSELSQAGSGRVGSQLIGYARYQHAHFCSLVNGMADVPAYAGGEAVGSTCRAALMYRPAAMPTTFARLLALPPGGVSGAAWGNPSGDIKWSRCVHPITF